MSYNHLFDSISVAKQILESIKYKIKPLSDITNISTKESIGIKSEKIELLWLKSKIDELLKDNTILNQNMLDCLKVIFFLAKKYEESLKKNKIMEAILLEFKEKEIYEEMLLKEKKEKENLYKKIGIMKEKYENILNKLKLIVNEDINNWNNDRFLISSLEKENEILKYLLNLNKSDEEINLFDKELKISENFIKEKKIVQSKKKEDYDWEKEFKEINAFCENITLKTNKNTEEIEENQDFNYDFENIEDFLKKLDKNYNKVINKELTNENFDKNILELSSLEEIMIKRK